MNLSHFKIMDNEPCPCGSKKLYKECCKGKQLQIKATKKPPEVQIMEKMRRSMKKCCLHPDQANCKGKIKAAHALQNNKIIALLAGEEHHVYMINTKKQPLLVPLHSGENIPMIEISRVSANNATTETCFCALHDNITFAVIEKDAPDFDESREDMKFIYAYKAFIFEYYKQRIAFDIFQQNFKDNPSVCSMPDMVRMYRMLQLKMQEMEPIKRHFDLQLLANTYNGVITCAVKLPYQIKFADYAYIAPDYDLNGKKIKHTIHGIMHRIAVTIFPEKNQSWLLLSCLKDEEKIYEDLFNQVLLASDNKLQLYINMVLPLYSENIVLSPKLWKSWDEKTQWAYTHYANLHGLEARNMGKAIKMMLRNAARDKTGKAYLSPPKINLFL